MKSAVLDLLQYPSCAADCLQRRRSSPQSTAVCNSSAARPTLIMCSMLFAAWYQRTASLLSFVYACLFVFVLFFSLDEAIVFHRAFTLRLFFACTASRHASSGAAASAYSLHDEGGEGTGVPGGNPRRRSSENATCKSPKIQVQPRHNINQYKGLKRNDQSTRYFFNVTASLA